MELKAPSSTPLLFLSAFLSTLSLFIRLVPLKFASKAKALFLSLSKLEGISVLIGFLVGRLRSCGINSPARFTSLWLYSQCRNHARTDIPCCAAHSALLKHQKQRSANRGRWMRIVRIVNCLMLSREQSINVVNAIIKTYKWHYYQRDMFTRGNNIARLSNKFLLTAFIMRCKIWNVWFLYITLCDKFKRRTSINFNVSVLIIELF